MNRIIKKLKRRLKKRIYNVLLALNEFDFSKLWPVFAGVAFAALFITACLTPTPAYDNASLPEVSVGSLVADDIRTTLAANSTLDHTGDVIAVFLPDTFESMTENELVTYMEGRDLYSFYLTGAELYALAEHSVSIKTETQVLYLDGLSFTYHKNRLPFDRVTELSLYDGVKKQADKAALYHIIATEEIFTLFHYGSYRSLGLMDITPKNRDGAQLSDYQEAVVAKDHTPLTVAAAIAYAAVHPEYASAEVSPSVVTTLGGFNLIALWHSPNPVTLLMCALFFAAVVLVWFAIPRLHRVVLWLRIYAIRSKKRGRHVFYTRRHTSHSGAFRRAG